jgi:hypothetical protein
VVEYRHEAATSVFKDRVAEVVPKGRVPEGERFERMGVVTSSLIEKAMVLAAEVFPAESLHRTK